MRIAVPPVLSALAGELNFPIYIVGGYVRNTLLFGSAKTTDVDICGAVTPEELATALEGKAKVIPVNPRIGTVLVDINGAQFEYTTFRKDSYPIGGAHTPNSVEFVTDIRQDAKRRDFTVNALYCNTKSGEIIDCVGGVEDLNKKLIRTVNDYKITFGEDGLRLLRLVRFAAQFGFMPAPSTYKGAREYAFMLKDITAERKRAELDKILVSDKAYGNVGAVFTGLDLISKLGFWHYIMPDLEGVCKVSSLAFTAVENAPLQIRLALLVYFALYAYKSFTPQQAVNDCGRLLGQNGLRYSNTEGYLVKSLIKYAAIEETEFSIKSYIMRHEKYVESLAAFANAVGASPIKCCAVQINAEMRANRLPYTTAELDLGKDIFEKYPVPPPKRSIALREVMLCCLRQNRRLCYEEQLAIIKRYL